MQKGDRAVVREGHSDYRYRIHMVKSVGPVNGQITLDTGERFMSDGRPIGRHPGDTRHLLQASILTIQFAIRQARISFLRAYDYQMASDELLERLIRTMHEQGVAHVPE